MNVLIVGGGKTGLFLGRLLAQADYALSIIERRPEIAAQLAAELPSAKIIAGDGSSPRILREAETHRADVVAAVTGDDEDNLVVALLARREFRVPLVIARVNNPDNAWLFTKDMGVDVAVDQAGIMGHLVQEEISLGELVTLLKMQRAELALVEERLAPGSQAVGKRVGDLDLPTEAVLIAILRKKKVLVPSADTTLEAHDEVLAIVKAGSDAKLAEKLK
jgi:trk system potassium uptake protein TrkA